MIYEQVRKNFPDAAPGELDAVLGWTRYWDSDCEILIKMEGGSGHERTDLYLL